LRLHETDIRLAEEFSMLSLRQAILPSLSMSAQGMPTWSSEPRGDLVVFGEDVVHAPSAVPSRHALHPQI
jgi:hypothetical protein